MSHRVSVIIPAFNAAATLDVQLQALVNQTYDGDWEVIVADNGSTDATAQLVDQYTESLPDLRVADASSRRGAAPARNAGAAAADGELLVFCDADDRVEPGWLSALVDSLAEHEFVTGSIDHDSLNKGMDGSNHWRSHVNSIPIALRFLPYALSGNMGITRAVFEEIGGFPEDLRAVGEDIALSWKAQLAGHDLDFEPRAVVAYRHRHDPGKLWRQYVDFGVADPVLYKRFRAHGVPRPRLVSMIAAYVRIILKTPLLFSSTTRPRVIRSIAKRVGRLKGSIRERVLYL